jgi:hypothetical protein
MPLSGMWCRVGLVRIDVSEESDASFFRVENKRTKKSVSSRPSNMGKPHFLQMIIVTTSPLTRCSLEFTQEVERQAVAVLTLQTPNPGSHCLYVLKVLPSGI